MLSLIASLDAEFDRLARLEPNWDGHGAPSLPQDVIAAARDFVRRLPPDVPRPLVAPKSSGDVRLEWHRGLKSLELVFESPSVVHYLRWRPEHLMEDEGTFCPRDSSTVLGMLRWFTNS